MWAIITLIFNTIIALPKIWQIIKDIQNSIETAKKQSKANDYQNAKTQLENAKTKKEVEDAADKFISNS